MNLFNQTQEQKTINKISKCISNKNNAFDRLRVKIIKELRNDPNQRKPRA